MTDDLIELSKDDMEEARYYHYNDNTSHAFYDIAQVMIDDSGDHHLYCISLDDTVVIYHIPAGFRYVEIIPNSQTGEYNQV